MHLHAGCLLGGSLGTTLRRVREDRQSGRNWTYDASITESIASPTEALTCEGSFELP